MVKQTKLKLSFQILNAKKPAEEFFCESCGAAHIRWMGKCNLCQEWNTIKVFKPARTMDFLPQSRLSPQTMKKKDTQLPAVKSWIGNDRPNNERQNSGGMVKLNEVSSIDDEERIKLFSGELDRVLGGGLVKGSVTLLTGAPGIGKSTLILQIAASVAASTDEHNRPVVYISGEETSKQIASRVQRLSLSSSNTYIICNIDIISAIQSIVSLEPNLPSLIIVDSIQTMYNEGSTGSAGSVTQIRDCTAQFVALAKSLGVAIVLIGHVTKSGDVAGPRILEHMVDTVLFLEGSEREDFRLLRSMKNRFGSTNEVGVFIMTPNGMLDVPNPSELFISSTILQEGVEGSAVAVIMEGTRPLLAEIQCLVNALPPALLAAGMKISPKRIADGFSPQRLSLICTVIEKRLKLSLWNRDIFVNVVGGLRITEPSSDLAVAVSIISSLLSKNIRPAVAFIGELGLAGELRGGRQIEARINEVKKMGFKIIVVPEVALAGGKTTSSSKKYVRSGSNDVHGPSVRQSSVDQNGIRCEIVGCRNLMQALSVAFDTNDIENITKTFTKSKSKSAKYRETERRVDALDDMGSDFDSTDNETVEDESIVVDHEVSNDF